MSNETVQPQLLPDSTDLEPIERGLRQLYDQAGHRIVFWNDSASEFIESIGYLSLPDVHILRLDEEPALAVKIRVERAEPKTRFLLYAPTAAPPQEEDWLLDIRLYSYEFQADRASMELASLGLGQSQSLRGHINTHLKFFKSSERSRRLKNLVQPNDDDADLSRKMIAVLVRAEHPEPFNIITALFQEMANGDGLEADPPAWLEMEKFGLRPAFWSLVERAFGYVEETPRLRTLALRLFATDLAQGCSTTLPPAIEHHTLPPKFWPDVAVCLNQWRDSTSRSRSYDSLSAAAAEILKIPDLLTSLTPEDLAEVMTFEAVERHILTEVRDRVMEKATLPAGARDDSDLKRLAARRQDGHWATTNLPESAVPRRTYHAAYDALLAAAELFKLVRESTSEVKDAEHGYRIYEQELFRVDQRYRHFCESSRLVQHAGWDMLKPLCERVEATYGNGYLAPLGLRWSEVLEHGLVETWKINDVPNQYDFFRSQVKRVLAEGEVKRVWVIISDALRYEAAHELTESLNSRYRFTASLSSQLGVLPSCTRLGMPALLPHKTLSFNGKGDVLADGRSTSGSENRGKILALENGMAVGADDLMKLNRDAGRALIRDAAVVYVYHDAVDATGDTASTEDDTFQGVRRAIDELGRLVSYIINRFNGSYVLVTADHGFLYQETAPDITYKSVLEDKPSGTVIAKKRYLLGHNLSQHDKVHQGSTAVTARATAGEEAEMGFWVPRSVNRFHFQGGAKFLHGGAMPQEVVVPIITIREKEGAAAASTKVRRVPVQVIGNNQKITTNRHRVQLIQTEPVSERVKSVKLQIAVYEGQTPVTNIEMVTFDSPSEKMEERVKSIGLSLQSGTYDKKKPYQLILRSADDDVEIQRLDVTIDLAIEADF